jgi:hypothetical protein
LFGYLVEVVGDRHPYSFSIVQQHRIGTTDFPSWTMVYDFMPEASIDEKGNIQLDVVGLVEPGDKFFPDGY